MKLTAIKTARFIGARDVDIALSSPVTLICGPNRSGKSSLAEAVRMALTGESVRVSLKKYYVRLVTEGQTVGYAVVEHDGQQSAILAAQHPASRRILAPSASTASAQRRANTRCRKAAAKASRLTGKSVEVETVTTGEAAQK
jgi:recombinational DNA repair ATPase RecF